MIELATTPWEHIERVAEPLSAKQLTRPTVLVRRRRPTILGPRGEELLYLPGRSHVSLFTGAAGMDLGVEQAGFCTLVQHEWDRACCETLMMNRPGFFARAALIQGDLRQTPTAMILGEAGLRCGEADLLTGGPPCQGFSTAGKRQVDDTRSDLVYEFLRVVREAQPRFFIMENVPGFMTLGKGLYFEGFLKAAHAAYYELVYGLADASEYMVPQRRVRFLCMGTRRDLAEIEGVLGSLPEPVCYGEEDRAFFRDTEGMPLFRHERGLRSHPPGVRYFADRPVLRPPAPIHGSRSGRRSKAYVEFYRRLEQEEPGRVVRQPAGGAE